MRVLAVLISLTGCGLPLADEKLVDLRPGELERLCETAFDDTVYHCDGSGPEAREDGVTDYRTTVIGCDEIESGATCQATVADWQSCVDAQRALNENEPCDLETIPEECTAISADCRIGFSFVDPTAQTSDETD